MSAVISACGLFRYRLDRDMGQPGPVYGYAGVNGSTATGDEEDHTTRKWIGFTKRLGGGRYIVGNAFAYRATDVRELAKAIDPIGPENDRYLAEIIAEADILVPCWGRISKVPVHLRYRFEQLLEMMKASGKPVLHFGKTACGCPKHPLMLGYDTPLLPWSAS